MLKYFVILAMLLPAHTYAETTENTLQFILDDYNGCFADNGCFRSGCANVSFVCVIACVTG
mgnify:CR=1 FL=1